MFKEINIKHQFLFVAFVLFFNACSNEASVEYDQNACKRSPYFVAGLGFSVGASLETSDNRKMGILLRQRTREGKILKEYQHPSWMTAGWLAPVLLDEQGNVYTAPAPHVSTLYNPSYNRNTIYKVDTRSGIMEEWMKLPLPDSTAQNPYGITALAYLCETGTIYASTFAGSDRLNERGGVYAIDAKSKKIIDNISGIDAMGMGIDYVEGKRKLYFGNGRNSNIFSIELNQKGQFSSKYEKAFSIENKGPRGDDKVRRIYTDKNGDLIIAGHEFNFNLIAPTEKQETLYKFTYDESKKEWVFVK